jgi:hypothetical protein
MVLDNKKGIELSVNFIVMLILGILALGMGIMFIPKLMNSSDTINTEVDQQTNDILQNMAMEGKVAIYPENFELVPRKAKTVGLGIMNVGDTGKFSIGVQAVFAKDERNVAIATPDIRNWTFVSGTATNGWYAFQEGVEVLKNDRQIIPVPFRCPESTKKGTYTFAIIVQKAPNFLDPKGVGSSKNYAGSKLVTITVK